MVKLKCGADSCVNNSDHLCTLNEISVEGFYADKASATRCDSFRDGSGRMTNSISGSASIDTFISCSAEHCKNNEECQCHADSIDIAGSRAHDSSETECSAFISRI